MSVAAPPYPPGADAHAGPDANTAARRYSDGNTHCARRGAHGDSGSGRRSEADCGSDGRYRDGKPTRSLTVSPRALNSGRDDAPATPLLSVRPQRIKPALRSPASAVAARIRAVGAMFQDG